MIEAQGYIERLFAKFQSRFILVMMIVTRTFAFVIGNLCVFYVNLTFNLDSDTQRDFAIAAVVVILVTAVLTVLLALRETTELRFVLRQLELGEEVSHERGLAAGRQAVLFPGRQAFLEAWIDPLTTIVPLCIFLHYFDELPLKISLQVSIAGFLGLSVILLAQFFLTERWLAPVVRHLIANNIPIPFDSLPPSRLQSRMSIGFSLTIVVTAVMIGALAYQRADDLENQLEDLKSQLGDKGGGTSTSPEDSGENFTTRIFLITVAAGMTGLSFSRTLANSVASRTQQLVAAMDRVATGELGERLQATGNDEIDILTRRFNVMVGQLDRNAKEIRELNVGLEHKVETRTKQLSKSKRSLQRSLKKLREYDKMKTEFFSNISHELRTPLTMILSPVDRIIETFGGEIPGRVTGLMNVVRINANRLLVLINQLLEFSKIEAGHATLRPSATDLNQLARDLSVAADPLAEQRGIQLRTRLDARLPIIAADVEKLETVITNLLSNALKFTPQGGVVELETRLCEQTLEVSVTDTGIGIDKADFKRVFERFVQLDGSSSRKYSGTGLGLPMVKVLVELHGGEIHLESELGLGSRFWFSLPLTCPAKGEAAQQPARTIRPNRFADLVTVEDEAPPTPESKHVDNDAPRILIADDTPEMRSMIAEILSDHFRVATVGDGDEGWEAAKHDPPDLIVSDVMMPNVDGYEFCRRIKNDPATAAIPFIMLTAKADLSMKIEGLQRGADDYLVKPFSPEELRARVNSLLRLKKLHAELERRNSELRATLDELRTTQAQLIQSEKMSSLGQLVAGLAHEINNAINAVYNGIQPLQVKAKRLEESVSKALPATAPSEARDEITTAFKKITTLATVIENGATRTARIVKDLKTFSHPGSETFETFDLNQSLDMCLNLLSSQLRDRITVRKSFGELPPVHGPSGQLNQVFMNILSNAQQAIADKGQITIETRLEHDRVSVIIRDTGCGISDEIQGRIFDPFFTTKPPGVGTGLGLSLSYGIIAKIGGTIECRSEVGAGSEFTITFPRDCDHRTIGTQPPETRPTPLAEVSIQGSVP